MSLTEPPLANTPPDVSVVIPARDAIKWLAGAIASVGPHRSAEIIVVDDGSSDGTSQFLVNAAEEDRRIVVLSGRGSGPSSARNLAIGVVRAPLVAFLDADDRWSPGKLAVQLAVHSENPDIGLSFTDYRHMTEKGENRGACFAFWPRFARHYGERVGAFLLPDAAAHIYAENVVGTSTVVARTDLLRKLGGFETSMGSAEDWDLWIRLAQVAPVACVPGVLCDYLMHRAGNVSGNGTKRAAAMGVIAGRYRETIARTAPWAIRTCRSRLLIAQAEAVQQDSPLAAALFRLRALILSPSVRIARELACTVLIATGMRRERRAGMRRRPKS